MRILISLLLSCAMVSNVSQAAKRPMTVDDSLNIVSVGDGLISPDGKQVFYSKSEMVWDKNDYKTTYYMASAKDGEAIQYIGEGSGGDFQFSPDGRYLSLIREVDDESSQLFLMPTSGGEAVQLTDHHGGIGAYKWTDDSSTIIFSADESRSEEEEKEHKLGADPVFVDEGPNGKEEARFSNLWAFDLESETETRLSEADFIVYQFDVSPDGSRIVLVGAPNTRVNSEHLTELYLLEVDSKELTRLTHNEAPEGNPLWAPDGKTFAYRAASDKKFELHNGYFWIMNPDTGSSRKLQGQHLGMVGGALAWTKNGNELLFTEQRSTHTNLYKLNVKTDKTTALSNFSGTLNALSFSKDRKRMVIRYEDIATPADLYVSALGSSPITSLKKAVRLTDANPWVREELQLTQGENLQWKSKGGMEIEGVFIPALNHSGGKMPLILEVHGGPAYYVKNEFREEYQVLAGLGYAILGPNVRGSTGYGDELLRGLMGEVGDGEFIDQMTGVDYVIANKNIDHEVIAAIKEEGIQHSQAMETLSYLTDIHGPRFAGTPGYYAAAEWARQQMNDWGLDAHLEAYPVDYLGWGILSHSVEMTSPRYMRLSAVPAPWASSTAEVSGEFIQLQFDDLEALKKYQGNLKGKILILPAEIEAGYEDDGYADYDFNAELHKMTQALKPSMSNPDDESDERIFEYLHDWPNQEKENRDKSREIIAWLKKEKVAALLEGTTLPYGVIGAKSSSALIMDSPENSLPHFILSREHHGRLLRTIEKGIPAAVKLSLSTRFYDEPKYHSNVIAEIKGSNRKKRDEVVLVGAHFDSWQTGTGASDNAFGSVVMMEALRILKTLNLKMDRTVRIGLWGGEEQYYDGSADYARKHIGTVIGSNDFTDAQAKISLYFNLDNGAGKIRGVYLQGNEKTRGFFTDNLAPFSYLGANHVSAMSGGGTDHIIFDDLNIPAFQLIQGSQGGPPVSTHHSTMDLYEFVDEEAMKQSAVIMASLIYHAATRDELLPRKRLQPPIPVEK